METYVSFSGLLDTDVLI